MKSNLLSSFQYCLLKMHQDENVFITCEQPPDLQVDEGSKSSIDPRIYHFEIRYGKMLRSTSDS